LIFKGKVYKFTTIARPNGALGISDQVNFHKNFLRDIKLTIENWMMHH